MKRKPSPSITPGPDMDISYFTVPRDMVASGLIAGIGPYAFLVWCVLKYFADYASGKSWPGIRRIAEVCQIAPDTVNKSILTLEEAGLVRVTRLPRKNEYYPKDCITIKDECGRRIKMVSINYTPTTLREKHKLLKASVQSNSQDPAIWNGVELTPFQVKKGRMTTKLSDKHEPSATEQQSSAVARAERMRLQVISQEIRSKSRVNAQ